MKNFILICSIVCMQISNAQKNSINYSVIDGTVSSVDASSIPDLVKKLTVVYHTDLEKVRAIFSWIAQNISYNYRSNRVAAWHAAAYHYSEATDTSTELKCRDQLVAESVFRKKTAVCDGYARLFKWMCDLASIRCELINGYGRTEPGRVGKKFISNHTWNAVYVDSSWHLLDVTWASGYYMYGSDDFIKHYDDHYFFTSPQEFAEDHFPEQPLWSLLPEPLTIREFKNSPFKNICFLKYNIISFTPASGVIEAAIGDTIRLELRIDPRQHSRNIGEGYFNDSSASLLHSTLFLKPRRDADEIVSYSFVVRSPQPHWLQLLYNNDLVLRYQLEVKK